MDDVLAYLEAAIDLAHQDNLVVDIGCPGHELQGDAAADGRAMGLRRWLLPVPVLKSPSFLLLARPVHPVPFRVAAALVEGLKSETIVQNDNAARYFPQIRPLPYEEAVHRALAELEERQVISRWCDSSGDIACDITDHDDPGGSILRDVRILPLDGIPPHAVFQAGLRHRRRARLVHLQFSLAAARP